MQQVLQVGQKRAQLCNPESSCHSDQLGQWDGSAIAAPKYSWMGFRIMAGPEEVGVARNESKCF